MKKQLLIASLIALFTVTQIKAQQGFGTVTPDPSAIIDAVAINKGILIPRVSLTSTTDVTTIATPATSLMVYNTATTGDVTPGFYYYDGSIWQSFATASVVEWADDTNIQGGLIYAKQASTAGNRVVIQDNGRVGMGYNTPTAALEIKPVVGTLTGTAIKTTLDEANGTIHSAMINTLSGSGTGTQYGVKNVISNTGNSAHYGVRNEISGSGSGTHWGTYNAMSGAGTSFQYGSYNYFTNTSDGVHTGVRNDFVNDGNGIHYGVNNTIKGSGIGNQFGVDNSISNTGSGEHYGTRNTLSGTGTGVQYGVRNIISNTGNNGHYGIRNDLSGSGTAGHLGVYNVLSGIGTGTQTGLYNHFTNTSDGVHVGVRNNNTSTGNGKHMGVENTIGGAGTGTQYGVESRMSGSGDGVHGGIRNVLSGIGAGDKYGSYSLIENIAGGKHYAVYGEAQKAGADVWAGYFKGKVAVTNLTGTDLPTDVFVTADAATGELRDATLTSLGLDNTNDAWVNATGRIELGTQSDGTTARLANTEFVALDNGDVGIGTVSPLGRLEVNHTGTAGIIDMLVFNSQGNSGLGRGQRMLFRTPSSAGLSHEGGAIEVVGLGGGENTYMGFSTSSQASGFSEMMRINHLGNVGVGTLTPAFKLDVAGKVAVQNLTGADLPTDVIVTADATTGELREAGTITTLVAEPWRNTDGTAATNASTNINYLNGSVGIGIATPDASAITELSSSTKGFLPPRMTTVNMNAIASPAEGLIVYNTDKKCLSIYTDGWNCLLSDKTNIPVVVAHYKMNTDQPLSGFGTTPDKINFNNQTFLDNDFITYDTASDAFTISQTGTYQITIQVGFSSSSGDNIIGVLDASSQWIGRGTFTSGENARDFSIYTTVLNFNIGDVFSGGAFNLGNTIQGIQSGSTGLGDLTSITVMKLK